jgi:putative ABC transport system permease protein
MNVFERTREIGTIGALGAKGHQILSLFIIEALILSSISSALGVLGGASIAEWLSRIGVPAFTDSLRYSYGGDRMYLIPAYSDWALAFFSVNFLCLASTLYPAYRALAMRPVEALQYV